MDIMRVNQMDLVRKQSEVVSLKIIRQSIQIQGILCDVYRNLKSSTPGRVYGNRSGVQTRNLQRLGRTRILGIPVGTYRYSKSELLGGYFQGSPCYSFPEMFLKEDDLIVEAGTKTKWVVVGPEILGGERTQIQKFNLANVMD